MSLREVVECVHTTADVVEMAQSEIFDNAEQLLQDAESILNPAKYDHL